MNTKELNEKLFKLMSGEQEQFKDWLLKQSPEEILNHTQEYTVRDDILFAFKEIELPSNLARALLESLAPLQEIYDLFSDKETDYMQILRDSIKEAAKHNFDKQKENSIKVLIVAPGEKPRVEAIQDSHDVLKTLVEGSIQSIFPFEDSVGIVYNDLGKESGLQLNRSIRFDENSSYDILAGTFLVVGLGDEDFCSLTSEQIEKHSKVFENPEIFFKLDNQIVTIPYNDHSKIPLYEKSFVEAMENDEISAFRLSARADNMCKTAVESAVSENYSNNRLNVEAAKSVVDIYGLDRVKKILALTVIVKDSDGRISPENKAWAKSVRPKDTRDRIDLTLVVDRINPGLTDLFINRIRKFEQERKPSVKDKLQAAKDSNPAPTAPKKKSEQVL